MKCAIWSRFYEKNNFFCNRRAFFFQEEVNEEKFGDRLMNTSENDKCERCGAIIPAKSTEKLCPACLMSGAMEPPGGKAETVSMGTGESLSLYGPSEFPCEFGDYRLLGLLGRGGMGTVYEAEQLTTGRRVALKMLGLTLDSPDMRKRFLREGRLAAGVNHPNSLYIYGSEEIEGLPVITMEIAGAGTLKDKLKKSGPLAVTEAVDAILDVISGLESAFANGVLHRDIKPSNCFVSPDGSVKVGDFGLSVSTLARTDTFVTAHGKIMGTPAYSSPEQLRGDALDLRADIYSVGATLFTLLTNRAPFEGDNAVQVVANAVNKKPKPLSELREDVPGGLERVVIRCLAKEPDGRYADYSALRNALLPFSSKEPEPASMNIRGSAGWIDFLIAFLIPFVALILWAGGEKLLAWPLYERSLYSARYYIALWSFGFLYF
ncbi:MAG: serine/threonine protein kinase, partial [Planctomycetota bacterium]